MRLVAALVAAALIGAACGSDGDRSAPVPLDGWAEVARIEADQPVGLAVSGADLIIGERLSGRVMSIPLADPAAAAAETIAEIDVSTDGQRGLLGVAVADDGRVIGSWTGPDERLVVGDVRSSADPIWVGPRSTDQATGGRLAVIDGEIVIAIGDLLDPSAVADPDTPNGKFLTIDAASGDTTALSGGWNNPFAFDARSDGSIVVYDNAPGNSAERLAVAADGAVDVLARGDEQTAPSGLALLDDSTAAVCRFLPQTLSIIDLDEPDTETVIADDCAYSVIALPDGGLAYGADDAVVILER